MTRDPKEVKIIGAGISGMTLAYFLIQKGFKVQIFEMQDRVGGKIKTDDKGPFFVESGPNAFLASLKLEEISQDIGVQLIQARPDSRKRFLLINSQMQRWPLSLGESFLFIFRFIKFLISKDRKPQEFETVEAWAQRKFGFSFTDKILKTFLQGVYAGDISKMSASYLFKSLFIKTPKGKLKGSVSTKDGMGFWIQKLEAYLKSKGVQFHINQKVETLSEGTCIASSAAEALQLLNIKTDFEMLPMVRVTVGLSQPKNKIVGFGVLIHPKENYRALGVLSNTYVFSQNAKMYNESWMFGGYKDKSAIDLSDEQIKNLISMEREKLLCSQDTIDEIYITRWKEALPHTTVEFERQMQSLSLPKNVWLTGNFVNGIGLAKIIEYNYILSQKIAEDLQK